MADIKKLSVEIINNSIDDKPNNNIVEIIGVGNTLVKNMSDEDTVMNDESSVNTKYKSFHKLTPYEMLVGKFTDENIKIMACVYNYILRIGVKNFGDRMWIQNFCNSSLCMRSLE